MYSQEQLEKINSLSINILNLSRNTLVVNLRFMDSALGILTFHPFENAALLSLSDSVALNAQNAPVGTDGEYYYYNPISVLNDYKSAKEIPCRRYLHSIFHCIYRHMFIGTLLDTRLWDIACDIAVENSLNELDITAADVSLVNKQITEIDELKKHVKYITAEILYRYFLDGNVSEKKLNYLEEIFSMDNHYVWYHRNEQSVNTSSVNTQSSERKKSHQKSTGSSKQKDNPDNQQDSHSGENKSSVNSVNNKENDENKSDGEQNNENNNNSSMLSKQKEFENMWREISEYIQTALDTLEKKRGLQAGGLTQNLLEVNREKYDYTSFLKKFAVMGEAMKINDDEFDYIFYTYGLQLYGKMPLIEPLEYKDVKRIKEFVIAIDTSGSVSGKLVQTFVNKTYNILKSTESFFSKINLHIIQCDADIQEDVKITSQEEFNRYLENMKLHGFGGTDFRPVFRYVNELIAKREFTNLKGLIYFTDGFGVFPEKQPDYSTAFVYVNDGYENPEVPVWAIKLVLQPEEIL